MSPEEQALRAQVAAMDTACGARKAAIETELRYEECDKHDLAFVYHLGDECPWCAERRRVAEERDEWKMDLQHIQQQMKDLAGELAEQRGC